MTTDVRRMVASAVAAALVRTGRSTRWLAVRSGIDHPMLQQKLGLRADFTVADLSDIADALGVPVADLAPRLPDGRGGGDRVAED